MIKLHPLNPKKAKFEELQRHARESRWSAWSFDDGNDVREFVVFVQPPMPSDTSLKSGLFKVAEQWWLKMSKMEVVSDRNLVFAVFAGRTEQLVRLQTTLLPNGTSVAFKVRKRKEQPAGERHA